MSTLRSPDVIHVIGVPRPSLYYTEYKPKNKCGGGRTLIHTHTQLNPVYLASMCLLFLSGESLGMRVTLLRTTLS